MEPPAGELDEAAIESAKSAADAAPDNARAFEAFLAAANGATGWTSAVLYVRAASAARRARDFNAAHRSTDAALRYFPLYTAALMERAFSHLDSNAPQMAIHALNRVHGINSEWPGLDDWLIHAHAAQKREEQSIQKKQYVKPPPRMPQGCEEVNIGSHPIDELAADLKQAHTTKACHGCLSSTEVQCPVTADKNTWLNDDSFPDSFSIRQEGTTVHVTRSDGGGTGQCLCR